MQEDELPLKRILGNSITRKAGARYAPVFDARYGKCSTDPNITPLTATMAPPVGHETASDEGNTGSQPQ